MGKKCSFSALFLLLYTTMGFSIGFLVSRIDLLAITAIFHGNVASPPSSSGIALFKFDITLCHVQGQYVALNNEPTSL